MSQADDTGRFAALRPPPLPAEARVRERRYSPPGAVPMDFEGYEDLSPTQAFVVHRAREVCAKDAERERELLERHIRNVVRDVVAKDRRWLIGLLLIPAIMAIFAAGAALQSASTTADMARAALEQAQENRAEVAGIKGKLSGFGRE